ncbi:MAG: mannose-1-phosphate guanylyltransferase/mannose-6-phosphate isomerase [Hyphomonadaceae bacterium]|nr:MAG: mannose-1-phosphate guanylyltransferase / mannose-6-phosphate isomerase [Caulobacteraceae bacterium]MBT9447338.1 mannose-1-phosphate guanylyltransferase/mannose-6-phosphate isomerase [Hyphomonadaceae bacterium]TPW06353.1 MAG: mannose-1-phosphate guanylyltransferase / mannose-6-phosphate isomerase [Alphaproteobacteria bacterium]
MSVIVPAILCGGVGSRLWPLSRTSKPKQFHPLTSDKSLLAETLLRGASAPGAKGAVLIAGESMRDLARAEASAAGMLGARIVLEPEGKNTAPAAALAALAALDVDPDAIVLMLPSDHHVGDLIAFAAAVATGAQLAADDRIVTFGIKPNEPHTGYGYITAGAPLGDGFAVAAFVEKPKPAAARALLEAGGNYWNSGIYMFRARFYLDELARLAPQMRETAENAWNRGRNDGDVHFLDAATWAQCPSDSIDYAVAEKTDRAAVVPVDMAWNDVGSWAALHEIAATGNETVAIGDVVSLDSTGCYVRAESRLVALVGVSDLVVIETPDAVLIMPRERAQDVKAVVETLKSAGRTELL